MLLVYASLLYGQLDNSRLLYATHGLECRPRLLCQLINQSSSINRVVHASFIHIHYKRNNKTCIHLLLFASRTIKCNIWSNFGWNLYTHVPYNGEIWRVLYLASEPFECNWFGEIIHRSQRLHNRGSTFTFTLSTETSLSCLWTSLGVPRLKSGSHSVPMASVVWPRKQSNKTRTGCDSVALMLFAFGP